MSIDIRAQTPEDLTKEMEQPLARIIAAENECMKIYLNNIAKQYEQASPKVRPDIFTQVVHTNSLIANYLSKNVLDFTSIPDGEFNPDLAWKLRLNLGLTRRNVVEKLNAGLHEITLYKYEAGQLKVTPRKQKTMPYILWLKENGYNPFQIQSKEQS